MRMAVTARTGPGDTSATAGWDTRGPAAPSTSTTVTRTPALTTAGQFRIKLLTQFTLVFCSVTAISGNVYGSLSLTPTFSIMVTTVAKQSQM